VVPGLEIYMMNKTAIQIIEKPEWVSWDDIRQCLYEAHAPNREKGINMTHYLWPAEKIKESLGEHGVMLVALDGGKVVGTAAFAERTQKRWYTDGSCYAFLCFDSVIPYYTGKGIFGLLDKKREEIAAGKGYSSLVFDTHSKNVRRQKIALKKKYKHVSFFRTSNGDHYNVIMSKWLDGCPYSSCYCMLRFYWSMLKEKAYINMSSFKRKV